MFKWLQMQQRYERRLRRIPALYKTTLLLLLFAKLHFAENPIEIEQQVQKISAIKEYISKSIFSTSD